MRSNFGCSFYLKCIYVFFNKNVLFLPSLLKKYLYLFQTGIICGLKLNPAIQNHPLMKLSAHFLTSPFCLAFLCVSVPTNSLIVSKILVLAPSSHRSFLP